MKSRCLNDRGTVTIDSRTGRTLTYLEHERVDAHARDDLIHTDGAPRFGPIAGARGVESVPLLVNSDPPPDRRTDDVTGLLLAWGEGDQSALDRLVSVVHHELRQLARRHMRGERDDHTLQTTALVNEAYLRLVDLGRVRWQDRAHFFAMSARLMRRILVDHARSVHSQKRGGQAAKVPIDAAFDRIDERGTDVVALDDALTALAALDLRKSQVVDLRFFAGLSVHETAEALHVSPETVMRDWKLAKTWLLRELNRRHGADKG
jgi:RNA polymerase sigma factor (TIGR02999 family)